MIYNNISVMAAAAAAAGDGQGAAQAAQAAAAAEAAAAADAAEERVQLQPETQYFLTIKTHTKIDRIPRAAWNALLRADDAPFVKHEWLWCLEESECAVPATGWNPCHLTVRMVRGKDGELEDEEAGEIVAAAPWYARCEQAHRSTHDMVDGVGRSVPFFGEWRAIRR